MRPTVSYADGTVVTFCFDAAGNRIRRVVSTAAFNCGPVNQAPTATDDLIGGVVGQQVQLQLLLNDSDPDLDPITITSVSAVSPSGSVVNNAGAYYFTALDVDTYTFTYTIEDPGGRSDTATVAFFAIEECGGFPSCL